MSVRSLTITTILAVAAASAGCSAGSTPHRGTPPPSIAGIAAALRPGTYQFRLAVDNRDRTYLAHVPPPANAQTRLPVVISLHAAGSDAAQQESYTQLDTTADAHSFIALYPNGTPFTAGNTSQLAWDAGTCCGLPTSAHVDDVAFIVAAIDDLARRTPIDRRRVYVSGYSNGAMMAYRVAAEASTRVAAVASVAGTIAVPSLSPTRAVPVIEFHSLDDPMVRWAGIPGLFLPVPTAMSDWVGADRCAAQPHTGTTITGTVGGPNAGLTATPITYSPCAGGTTVVLWELTGSGHVWPGRPATPDLFGGAPLGRPTTLIDADDTLWRFLSRYELPE